jgi:hypothetical protein
MFNPKLLLVASDKDVVLCPKGTVQAVFESGKRGQKVVVSFRDRVVSFNYYYLPYTNLGVLVSCEDVGVVKSDGLNGTRSGIVVIE